MHDQLFELSNLPHILMIRVTPCWWRSKAHDVIGDTQDYVWKSQWAPLIKAIFRLYLIGDDDIVCHYQQARLSNFQSSCCLSSLSFFLPFLQTATPRSRVTPSSWLQRTSRAAHAPPAADPIRWSRPPTLCSAPAGCPQPEGEQASLVRRSGVRGTGDSSTYTHACTYVFTSICRQEIYSASELFSSCTWNQRSNSEKDYARRPTLPSIVNEQQWMCWMMTITLNDWSLRRTCLHFLNKLKVW